MDKHCLIRHVPKILFGTDGQNLEETDKLYNLTEAERELGEQTKRTCLIYDWIKETAC